MKQFLQFITLLFIGANSLQILLTIGTAVLIFQVVSRRVTSIKSSWVSRRRKRALETDMWAID